MISIKQVLTKINLNIDNEQKYIFISMFFSQLIFSYVSPSITKEIITNLPAQWIAFESLFFSISTLLIGVLWKDNVRKNAIKYFLCLAISETILFLILGIFLCFVYYNVWIFAICTLIYSSLVSIFVGKCIMFFKSKLFQDKKREEFDNNLSIISSIVCIVGFSFSLFMLPSLKLSLLLWSFACVIDDIGWIVVYIKNKNKLTIDNSKK